MSNDNEGSMLDRILGYGDRIEAPLDALALLGLCALLFGGVLMPEFVFRSEPEFNTGESIVHTEAGRGLIAILMLGIYIAFALVLPRFLVRYGWFGALIGFCFAVVGVGIFLDMAVKLLVGENLYGSSPQTFLLSPSQRSAVFAIVGTVFLITNVVRFYRIGMFGKVLAFAMPVVVGWLLILQISGR